MRFRAGGTCISLDIVIKIELLKYCQKRVFHIQTRLIQIGRSWKSQRPKGSYQNIREMSLITSSGSFGRRAELRNSGKLPGLPVKGDQEVVARR